MENYTEKLLMASEEVKKLDKCFKAALAHMTDAVEDVERLQIYNNELKKNLTDERVVNNILVVCFIFSYLIGLVIGRYSCS